jgi:RNA polymerase primary sigma factor
MYLREMGSVELLSREGEIAIAKRIEAGRETMIAGLCESPLTFQAIIIWRDELNEGKILLRDIIDLEATYAGPDAKQRRRRAARRRAAKARPPPTARPAAAEGGARRRPRGRRRRRRRPDGRARGRGRGRRRRHREFAVARRHGGRAQAAGGRDLRQGRRQLQEAAPLQDQNVENKLKNESLSPARSAATRS